VCAERYRSTHISNICSVYACVCLVPVRASLNNLNLVICTKSCLPKSAASLDIRVFLTSRVPLPLTLWSQLPLLQHTSHFHNPTSQLTITTTSTTTRRHQGRTRCVQSGILHSAQGGAANRVRPIPCAAPSSLPPASPPLTNARDLPRKLNMVGGISVPTSSSSHASAAVSPTLTVGGPTTSTTCSSTRRNKHKHNATGRPKARCDGMTASTKRWAPTSTPRVSIRVPGNFGLRTQHSLPSDSSDTLALSSKFIETSQSPNP